MKKIKHIKLYRNIQSFKCDELIRSYINQTDHKTLMVCGMNANLEGMPTGRNANLEGMRTYQSKSSKILN